MAVFALAACEGQFGRMAAINATPTMSAARAWCAVDGNAGTRDCVYDSRAECMASRMWLSAGSCYENPFYQRTTPAAPRSAAR
jgi:hypothetical protein